MFTINVHEKLSAIAKKRRDTLSPDVLVQEVNNILAHSAEEDQKALASVGLDHNIRAYKADQATIADLVKYENEFGYPVFTHADIRTTAIKYGLRFLPSHMYKGTVDPLTGRKLVEFQQKFGVWTSNETYQEYVPGKISTAIDIANLDKEIDEAHRSYDWGRAAKLEERRAILLKARNGHYDLRQRDVIRTRNFDYFIMAPASAFRLQERPKDPLLFVKVANDRYLLLHKWGNDLSLFRRVLVMYHEVWARNVLFLLAALMLVQCIVVNAVTVHDPTHPHVALFNIAFTLVLCAIFIALGNAPREDYAEDWDSEFKN